MNQTNPDYTFGIASWEIILLLLGSFLLGMLLCWLLRKMGICCATRATDSRHDGSPAYPSSTTLEGGRKQREFPSGQVTSGGYTADINSLLRNREPAEPPVPPRQPLRPESTASQVAAVASAAVSSIGSTHKDDLKKLEGIGPKLEQILNAAGIQNFEQLAAMTPDRIKPILEAAGNQFRMHDPKSWPYQAELAAKGEWERLKEYQHLLIGGKD
jgi:predicted flap endonuclease-1-like 5' DNA nuclease